MMKRLLQREEGQSAVETVFSIPLFLFIFLIGFQLFAITWNAQFTHARSRYDALSKASHRPCSVGSSGVWITGEGHAQVSAEPMYLPRSNREKLDNYSYIVCY